METFVDNSEYLKKEFDIINENSLYSIKLLSMIGSGCYGQVENIYFYLKIKIINRNNSF